MKRLPDSLRRALRTFLQAFIGTFSALAIPVLWKIIDLAGSSEGLVRIDVTLIGNALIAGCIAGIIALVSYVQNLLEDKTAIPKLLK
jgi:TRAP-type C4-dicarboxylate transport system permease small subunit